MSDIEVKDGRERWGLVYYDDITTQQAKELPDNAFRLWVMLHTYAPKNRIHGWTISVERLGEDCHYSRSTIFRALKSLKDSNLVQYFKRGACNHYILIRPRNLKSETEEEKTGVIPDTSTGSSADTSTGSSADTHTGVLTGATTSNKPPNPLIEIRGNELQGFLGKALDELFKEIEAWTEDEQLDYLLGDLGRYTEVKYWNVREQFKTSCESLDMNYPNSIGLFISEKSFDLLPALGGRKRRAIERRHFLTECQEIVQSYGRQL